MRRIGPHWAVLSLTLLLISCEAGSDSQNSSESPVKSRYAFFPDYSPDGNHIAFVSDRDGDWEIYVMDYDGQNPTRLTHSPSRDSNPVWSHDGKRIFFYSDRDGNREVYVMDANGANPTNLTRHPAQDGVLALSRDGKRLAFYTDRDGNGEVYAMNTDGSGPVNISQHPARDRWPAFGPVVALLYSSDRDQDNSTNIYFHTPIELGPPTRITDLEGDNYDPEWSPDGSRIVFTHDHDGKSEIFVVNYYPPGDPVNLTNGRGQDLEPTWSPDGKRIAFVSITNDRWEIWTMKPDGTDRIRLAETRGGRVIADR